MENDMLATICKTMMGEKRPTLSSMNTVASHHLSNYLLPSMKIADTDPFTTKPFRSLGDTLSHLCSHPSYKLLTIRDVPLIPPKSVAFSTHNWNGLLKHLKQMSIADVSSQLTSMMYFTALHF
jgi:tubulin delta